MPKRIRIERGASDGHVRRARERTRLMDVSPFAEICHPKKRAFLAAYAQTGNKSRAAEMAGIVKQTIYTSQWREDRGAMTSSSRRP